MAVVAFPAEGNLPISALDQDIRFCTTADNVKIAYAVSGKGPLLVMPATWLSHLEHQWTSLAWRPWLETLSRKFTLLRYDSRGCGLSDRAPAELSFAGWIRGSRRSSTRPASGSSTSWRRAGAVRLPSNMPRAIPTA